jgi:uncharacterized repeat protein (TIGR02543 family)
MNKLLNKNNTFAFLLLFCIIIFAACTLEDDIETLRPKIKSEPVNIITFSVTFDANDGVGTVPETITATADSKIKIPSGNSITKFGYTFGGWNTNSSGTGDNYLTNSEYTVTGDVTLYAKWNEILYHYTVSFSVNGGNGIAPSSQTVAKNSTITLPDGSGLTKSGYIFSGWNTSSSGTGINYTAGSSYIVTDYITLYAKWVAAYYTVTFLRQNGNTADPSPQQVVPGSGITLPVLSETGYIFAGWSTTSYGGAPIYDAGSDYTPTGHITLYGVWNVAYVVIFNLNGGNGTIPPSQTVTYNSRITLPDSSGFTKNGYTFDGWMEVASGSGTVYNAGYFYTVKKSITLYAKWK